MFVISTSTVAIYVGFVSTNEHAVSFVNPGFTVKKKGVVPEFKVL